MTEQDEKYKQLEQQYKKMLSSAKEVYESEINLLKTKLEYAELKQHTELENKIAETKKETDEYYNVKNSNDIQEIKDYYENKIKDLIEWYEKEIPRRQNETAAWHENNLREKVAELTKNYEETIAQLNKRFNDEIEVLSTQLIEQKKYYEKQLKPFNRLIRIKNKLKSKENKTEKKINKTPEIKQEVNIITQPIQEKNVRPKVSVILPVYNVGKYLRQSLDSLINQSLKEIEIICVNDGSTDDSYDILEEYKNKDNRIKVIHKENKGTGAARNDGLKLATGECIGFVDPDDWVKPIMYERLYTLLKEKNLDIAMCMPDGYDEKNGINRPFPYFVDDNFKDMIDDRIFNWRDLSPFKYPMCVWNKLYTKELFDKNQIWFTEGLDFEDHSVIFGTLLTAKKMFFIREKLYVYRFNRVGSVLSDNNRRLIDHIEIFNIVEDLMKRTNTYTALRNDFLFYKIHNLFYYYSMIKDKYKQEYYQNMVKSIKDINLNSDEINMLSEKYPEIKSYV